MYAKLIITGTLEVATGLHIGTSGAFSAIGAVDSPVIRDTLERDKPIIPGSSLKGKMRTLLARQYNDKTQLRKQLKEDDERILRLFGCSENKKYRIARLLFSDMILSNADELRERGADSLTEVKFENTINRITAEANPRQIERVIRGSKFDLDLIYDINSQRGNEVLDDETLKEEMLEDFQLISDGFKLLRYDYLGGNGSRGYGKVKFSGITAKPVAGEVENELIEKINNILKV